MNVIPDKNFILKVYHNIKNYIHRTPVLTSDYFTKFIGAKNVYFKCENVQKTGSFKIRGAINAVSMHLDDDPTLSKRGFITHSSGNHAGALAYAGKILGIPITVVMPKDSKKAKIDAVKSYGGEIIYCEPDLASRESTTNRIIKEREMKLIHPYDDYLIIAGQSTVIYELLYDIDDIDYVVSPVGGGGLLSGSLLSSQYFAKGKLKVIAGEPELAKDAFLSFKNNRLFKPLPPITVADGLRTGLGERNFDIVQKYLHDIILVEEDEIIKAMFKIFERMKLVVEPSSATAVAAVIKEKERFKDKNVAIILSGGNVDLQDLPFKNI